MVQMANAQNLYINYPTTLARAHQMASTFRTSLPEKVNQHTSAASAIKEDTLSRNVGQKEKRKTISM